VATIDDFTSALRLKAGAEPGQFAAGHIDEGHGVVFGGQLMAQAVVAATQAHAEKELLSLHTVFARAASFDEPLSIGVEILQSGRSMGSAAITMTQSRGVCAKSIALLHAPDADLIRHADGARQGVGTPDDWPRRDGVAGFWDLRFVDDVDISDPALVGPPELQVWSRFPGAPADLPVAQATLAYASDGMLIATAMRPHEGVGQSLAHVTIATTVLAHTITFHEPFAAEDWLLIDQRSTYAGRGRGHGEAKVFAEDGRLVASFTQENMIRG
jgi:acyl-CoA thioesterase